MKIERKQMEWGVELSCQPVADSVIRATLTKRSTGGIKVGIGFSGVSMSKDLKLAEAQVWVEAMNALLQEARIVAAEMKG